MSKTTAAISHSLYRLRRITRKVWVRVALIGFLGIVAALSSGVLAPLVPDAVAEAVTASAVETILEIVASGMLAVTIFSLSVMVSARQSASTQVTPRSHQILLEDTTTQNVLATFLGAFLFALVGIITLSTEFYSGAAAAVMLGFTILVIALMVIAILRWIDHLSELGSVVETTRKVEQAATSAMQIRRDRPCLGAMPAIGPPQGRQVATPRIGYVQHVDVANLSERAEEGGFTVDLSVQPGSYVVRGGPLLHHTGSDAADNQLRDAFVIGDSRVFDQDPRFGVIVLTEIAQRALSPGINDPGTAIDVLTRLYALLAGFRSEISTDTPKYPRVRMAPLSAEALVLDAFDPIARDGAGMVEVQIRLQKALAALAGGDDPEMAQAARDGAVRALERALSALTLDADKVRLRRAVEDSA